MMASNNDSNTLLSFGNILQNFPEFLIYVLPYIADRIVFNSIASCNRDTNEKSKAILPPWPKNYRLPTSNRYSIIAAWSPDGTRVAYTCHARTTIVIADQRHAIIYRINNNGAIITELKFSPDGNFLVSAYRDSSIVKLWDNNVTGNYEQLQEWNMREDMGGVCRLFSIAISACSKYIVLASCSLNRVVLKSVENGETIKSLTPQPVMKYATEVMFSTDCHAIFVCSWGGNFCVIKLWRPYLDDAYEDSLITLWEKKNCDITKIVLSHDKTMIAIQDYLKEGMLLSIDNNYSCKVQTLKFQGSLSSLRLLDFTPDDECIIYATPVELKNWSVAERKFTDKEYLLCSKRTMNSLYAMYPSPNNRQIIVHSAMNGEDSLYMESIF